MWKSVRRGIKPCWNLSDSDEHLDGYACRGEFVCSYLDYRGNVFMIEGFFRCRLAKRNRDMTGWRSTFGSGVCAILFSLLVLLAFPSSSAYTLGILLGVNLVMFGTLRIALGLMGREIANNNQIESGVYVAAP
jgi:hypothetical protein